MTRADDTKDTLEAGAARAGQATAAEPSVEDALAVLRDRFGDFYEESHEHGKREFRDALVEHFGLDEDDALRLLDSLEEARVIRFHSGTGHRHDTASGPRVGLFDEPRRVPEGEPAPEPAARGWKLGPDERSGTSQ